MNKTRIKSATICVWKSNQKDGLLFYPKGCHLILLLTIYFPSFCTLPKNDYLCYLNYDYIHIRLYSQRHLWIDSSSYSPRCWHCSPLARGSSRASRRDSHRTAESLTLQGHGCWLIWPTMRGGLWTWFAIATSSHAPFTNLTVRFTMSTSGRWTEKHTCFLASRDNMNLTTHY